MDEKPKEIVVEVYAEEIMSINPILLNYSILKKLKDAGIPIIGLLLFQGVSTGILMQEENFVNNSYIFRWKA